MSNRTFCIHGHFYQPSREDPLTGEVPPEDGASPFLNWNIKIQEHCYRPNAALGNFERVSFDVGPTLTNWMISQDSLTLSQIVAQDRSNYRKYGVGNAMAQSYHHTILPLSTRQDKITQIEWGIADFEHRFGHKPAGLWMPETAVDQETMEIMADRGIQFTILAPWQAEEVDLDVTRPYLAALSDGRKLPVFFYERELSSRVSFDSNATLNADDFITKSLNPRFSQKTEDQFLIIATDGELYGHHKPFRDKFLAHLTTSAPARHGLQISYPALWLQDHQPEKYVHIRPNTSWSCHHGVERWRGECSCAEHAGWKAPLRKSLESIAELIDNEYLNVVRKLMPDPWRLRHEYIHVLHGKLKLEDLVGDLTGQLLPPEQIRKLDFLLTAQSERQRMLTSCGWFFEDFDRIEPRNNVAYAAQAVWMTFLATGVDLTHQSLGWLRLVKSWRSGLQADTVFLTHLRRAQDYQRSLMIMSQG